jgi:hypothetical protein
VLESIDLVQRHWLSFIPERRKGAFGNSPTSLRPEQSSTQPADSLSEWAKGRGDSIATDDTITQKIDNDPISQMPDYQGFTYFPYVGVPYMGMRLYSSPSGSAFPIRMRRCCYCHRELAASRHHRFRWWFQTRDAHLIQFRLHVQG